MATKLAYKGNEITGAESISVATTVAAGNNNPVSSDAVNTAIEAIPVTAGTGTNSAKTGYQVTVSGNSSFGTGGAEYAVDDSGGYVSSGSSTNSYYNKSGANIVTGESCVVGGTGNTVPGKTNAVFGSCNTIPEKSGDYESNANLIAGFNNTIIGYGSQNIIGGTNNEFDQPMANIIVGKRNTNKNASYKWIRHNIIAGEQNTFNGNLSNSLIVSEDLNTSGQVQESVIGTNDSSINSVNQSILLGTELSLPSTNLIHSFLCGSQHYDNPQNQTTKTSQVNDSMVIGKEDKFYGANIENGSIIVGHYLDFNNVYTKSAAIGGNDTEFNNTHICGGFISCNYGTFGNNGNVNNWNGSFEYSIIAGNQIHLNEINQGLQYSLVVGDRLNARGKARAVVGYHNADRSSTNMPYVYSENDIFSVGNGETEAKSNAFRVSASGVYAVGAYNASGADYAEMFEWADGNLNFEDRRGLFVTLDGEKISVANSDSDFILGITSGNPSVLADMYDDQYKDMFMRDIYGAIIWETIDVEETTIDKEVEETDPETGKTVKKFVQVTIPAHTEKQRIINPDYDPDQEYIGRASRPEWQAVGMLGKLVMVDDGTAEVNNYIKPSKGGIATASSTPTRYRVMSRLDETHIKILVI